MCPRPRHRPPRRMRPLELGAPRVWLFAFALAACGTASEGAPDAGEEPDVPQPGSYGDSLTVVNVLPKAGFVVHPQQMMYRGSDTLLYCGAPAGLHVVDVSDTRAPQRLATLEPNGRARCQHLADGGQLVFATSRGDETAPPSVSAFDFSQTPPQALPSFTDASRSYEGVAAAGTISYVAVHDQGLIVLDWSSGAPVEVGAMDNLVNAWGVALRGSSLYVADAGYGLVVVDVSEPTRPALVGKVAIPDGASQAIAVDGDHAYLAMATGGLAVVDVSDPSAPQHVVTVDTPGSATELSLAPPYLAVADWNDVRVFDVSTPSSPELAATEAVLDSSRNFTRFLGVAMRQGVVVGGEFNGDLYTFEFAPRPAPDIRASSYDITFARTEPGAVDAVALIVSNEGQEPLVATEVRVDGAAFSTDAGAFVLAPGERAVIEIAYRPEDANPAEGTVTIVTDDPDEATTTVALAGNGDSLQVGDPAPEVELSMLGGGTWELSAQTGQVVVLAYFATF